MKKRVFSLFTSLIMVISLVGVLPTITASAGQADDLANKAQSYLGYGYSTFGLNGQWCARFTWKCADWTGISSSIIPHTDSCQTMYNTMINSGSGYVVSSATKGDLVFYKQGNNAFHHVGIMIDNSNVVSGNMGSSWSTSTVKRCAVGSIKGYDTHVFVRPRYGGSNVVTWNELWDSERGETATTFIGGAYISNGEITDWGFRYNITGSSDYHYIERPSQSWDNSSRYFRFVKWTDRVLREGTDYQVYAYIDVEGVRYWSNCFSLKTSGHTHSYTTNFSTNFYTKKTCSCGDVIESWNNNYYNGDYAFCATIKCVGTNKYLGISNNKGGTNVDEVSYNVEANNIDLNDSTYWLFEKQSDGYYKISNVKSGGVLDVYGVEDKDCANVHAYHTFVNGNNQLWRLYKNGSYFYLKPKHSNRCLDIAGNVTNANIYQYNGTVAQQFVIDVHKHDWVVDVIKKPTCSETGIVEYTCAACGIVFKESTPKLDYKSYLMPVTIRTKETVKTNQTETKAKRLVNNGLKYWVQRWDGNSGLLIENPYINGLFDPTQIDSAQIVVKTKTDNLNGSLGFASGSDYEWKQVDFNIENEYGINENNTEFNVTVDKSVDETYTYTIRLKNMNDLKPNIMGSGIRLCINGCNAICTEPVIDPDNDGRYKWTENSMELSITEFKLYDKDNKEIYDAAKFTSHNYETTVVKPTCTENGYTLHKCLTCGNEYKDTYTNATGHKFGSWTVTKKATCTTAGTQTRKCSTCGITETQTIKAIGHNYSTQWTVDKQATCTIEGSKSHHCTVCGDKKDVTVIPSTGHSYGSWTVTKKATCTTAGTQTRKCSTCGITETQTIKAIGHNYSTQWTVDKQATCTIEGSKSHHCTVCGDKKDVTVIPSTGHSYGSWTVTKKATCTTAGTQTRKCSTCGETETQTIKATGHNYSTQWTVDKAATCTAEGSKSHHCLNCGVKKDVTAIAKTAHNWTYEIVDPSYADEGYTYVECSNCGDYYYTDYTDQLVLDNIEEATLTSATNSVRMEWDYVYDADGYCVFKYNTSTKKWERVAITSNTSYTFNNLTAGTTYYFTVRAYIRENGRNYFSPSFTTFRSSTTPANVNLKLTAGLKRATASWNKVNGATGYLVYYKPSANSKWIGVANTKKLSVTKTGLVKGKTYWFTVRAYRTVNGKNYFGAFTTKTVKVK